MSPTYDRVMASKTEAQQAHGGSRRDVYADVTNRMIAALEAGTVPWHKPWRPGAGRPRSMSTGQPYRGVNVLLLGLTAGERGYASPWWGTFRDRKSTRLNSSHPSISYAVFCLK